MIGRKDSLGLIYKEEGNCRRISSASSLSQLSYQDFQPYHFSLTFLSYLYFIIMPRVASTSISRRRGMLELQEEVTRERTGFTNQFNRFVR